MQLKIDDSLWLDFTHAINYYQTVNQATRFSNEFYTALELIEENPYLYQIINSAKHRRCLLKTYPYSIFYRVITESQIIDVLALAHQARKPYFL